MWFMRCKFFNPKDLCRYFSMHFKCEGGDVKENNEWINEYPWDYGKCEHTLAKEMVSTFKENINSLLKTYMLVLLN